MASKYKLWRFIWIPGLISLITALVLAYFILRYFEGFGDWLISWYTADFARDWFAFAARISALLVLIGIGVLLFRYIVLTLSFPFMSFVSQKLELKLYGNIAGDQGAIPALSFVKELIRGAVISAILIYRELGLLILLFLISLIPGLAIITAPLIFLIQSYHAGCANLDYTLERYFNVKDALIFMSQNKGMAIGNGLIYMMIIGIPFIGVFVAPILGTISGALIALDFIRDDK